jgi:hypothetical protein
MWVYYLYGPEGIGSDIYTRAGGSGDCMCAQQSSKLVVEKDAGIS